ncbi:hypothetical protein PIB30_029199 [Stylosanthes scabra]|uniref:Uncharacterized protein n=1 Tax=Stylosanthes scabra TaxID=79078 RepID=A0ABU6QAP0_9FABA|nr:hypothetical protein [Stylosanthes scabra]
MQAQFFTLLHSSEYSASKPEILYVTPPPTTLPPPWPPTPPLKGPAASFSFCVISISSPPETAVVAPSIVVHSSQPLSLLVVHLKEPSPLSVALSPSPASVAAGEECPSQPSLRHGQRTLKPASVLLDFGILFVTLDLTYKKNLRMV